MQTGATFFYRVLTEEGCSRGVDTLSSRRLLALLPKAPRYDVGTSQHKSHVEPFCESLNGPRLACINNTNSGKRHVNPPSLAQCFCSGAWGGPNFETSMPDTVPGQGVTKSVPQSTCPTWCKPHLCSSSCVEALGNQKTQYYLPCSGMNMPACVRRRRSYQEASSLHENT